MAGTKDYQKENQKLLHRSLKQARCSFIPSLPSFHISESAFLMPFSLYSVSLSFYDSSNEEVRV